MCWCAGESSANVECTVCVCANCTNDDPRHAMPHGTPGVSHVDVRPRRGAIGWVGATRTTLGSTGTGPESGLRTPDVRTRHGTSRARRGSPCVPMRPAAGVQGAGISENGRGDRWTVRLALSRHNLLHLRSRHKRLRDRLHGRLHGIDCRGRSRDELHHTMISRVWQAQPPIADQLGPRTMMLLEADVDVVACEEGGNRV